MVHHKSWTGVIVSWMIIAVLFVNVFLLGHNRFNSMEEDYSKRIGELNLEIVDLQNNLEDKLKRIDNLETQLNGLGIEIENLDTEFELKVDRLDEQIGEYDDELIELNQRVGDLVVESESFSDTIPDVIDATVSVITDKSQGSGAIISRDGLVVTNYHVIDDASRASVVMFNGEVFSVGLEGFDIENDIAVLKILNEGEYNYFRFDDSDDLKPGQKVVALGNPAGYSFTATEGIISSPSRTGGDGLNYIQTDATLNPGNSGGPLINSAGKLIGIVNYKVIGYEELGFAIPSNRVESVVREILN